MGAPHVRQNQQEFLMHQPEGGRDGDEPRTAPCSSVCSAGRMDTPCTELGAAVDKAGVTFWLVRGAGATENSYPELSNKAVMSVRHLRTSGEVPCEHTHLGGISGGYLSHRT